MNVTESVEFVDTSLSASDLTGSVLLTMGQDYENYVPFLTVYGCSDNYNNHLIDVTIDDFGGTARVNFERAAHNSCALAIKCYVVEFNPDHVYVQQGSFGPLSGATTTAYTVASGFDQTRTGMVHYWESSSGERRAQSHMVRGRVLSNGTQVDFYRNGGSGTVTGHYFLFTAQNDEFVVGHYDRSMGGTSTGNTATINFDSDPLNTMVWGSFASSSTNNGYQREQTCRIFQYFYNQARVDRGYAASTIWTHIQVLTFQDGADGYIHVIPRNPIPSFGTGDTTINSGWSGSRYVQIPVDQDWAMVLSGTPYGLARGDGTSTVQIDSLWTGMEFTGDYNVQFNRNSTGGNLVSYPCFTPVDWQGYYVDRGPASGTLDPNETFVKSVQNEYFEVEAFTNGFALNRGQDPDNCALFVSFRGDGATIQREHMATIFLGKPGFVTARCLDGTGYLKVNVSVVEFYPDQVKVQKGMAYTTDTTASVDIDPIAGGTSKAFLLSTSYSNSSSNAWDRHLTRSRFTSSSGIEFYKYDGAAEIEHAWFVVEDLQDNFVCAHYNTNSTNDIYLYSDVRTYDYERLFVIGSNASSTSAYYPDRTVARYYSQGYPVHRPARSDVHNASDTKYWSLTVVQIERTNRRYIQHWNPKFSGGSTSENATYGAQLGTNPDSLTIYNTNRNSVGRHNSSSNQINQCYYEFQITDYENRTMQATRDAGGTDGYPSAIIINWLGYDHGQTLAETPKRSLIKSVESWYDQTGTGANTYYPSKGQDVNNCLPFVTQRASSTDYYMDRMGNGFVLWSGDQQRVRWNPGWGAAARDYHIHLIEFDPDQVRIQHGTVRMGGTSQTVTLPTAVDTTKAFLVFGITTDGGTRQWNDFLTTGIITNSTTLTFRRADTGGNVYIYWHVAECLQDQWNVQSNETHQNSSATNVYSGQSNRTGSERTLVLCSYSSDTNAVYSDRALMRVYQRFDDIVQFNRSSGSDNVDYTVAQWVEFKKTIPIRIYRDYCQMTGTQNSNSQSLKVADPQLDSDRTMIINQHQLGFCRVDSTGSDDVDNGLYKFTLNGANVDMVRYQNSSNSYNVYQAVEWPPINTHYFEGYVTELGEPVVRNVSAYRMDTNELVDTTTSASGTGYYRLETTYSGMHYLVCNDDEAGTNYNDLIWGKMYPEEM